MADTGVIPRPAERAFSVKTIATAILERGGYTSGFDYLRVILATSVIVTHAFGITGSPRPFPNAFATGVYCILPMFFSLSGFLVAASLVRVNSIVPFFTLRGLRLGPALLVEVLFSALILGPIFTTEPLHAYFTADDFKSYFLNIMGWPHYSLPGVFKDSAASKVNGSLWTVPYEAECYIALAVVFLCGLIARRKLFLVGILAALVVFQTTLTLSGTDLLALAPVPRSTMAGRHLVMCFLVSVLIYVYRERIPHSAALFAGCLVASLLTVARHDLVYIAIPCVAYVTIFLGLMTPRKIPLLFSGDYSYGLYLYAGPIQQAVRAVIPTMSAYANLLLSLPLVFLFAAFSWHVVEKRFLALRRLLIPTQKRSASHSPSSEMISPDKSNTAVAEN